MSRIKLSLALIVLALSIFTFFRGILLVTYFDEFSALSLFEILQAFIYGLRFDFALTSLLFLFPILLINLPFKWAENRNWIMLWFWVCFVFIIAICLLLAADIIYYAYVNRHISQELRLILHDTFFILQTGLSSYKFVLLAFIGFVAFLFLIWKTAWNMTYANTTSPFVDTRRDFSFTKRLSVFIIIFLVLVIGLRGGTQRKTIHVINAFSSGNPSQGNLILNGAYSALRTFDNKPSVSHDFYSPEDLKKQEKEMGLYQISDRYPFQKKLIHADTKEKKLNIVIVLLESWSYKFIDALAGNNYGVTPNFDKLVKDGLAFTRFYSSGQRSIEGVQAVLTGVPNLIDLPRLGWGLENSRFSRLGSILQKHDYHTLFAQSSRRTSFHLDGIAAAAGFKNYYGMEDVTIKLDYADPSSFWFGWDHETFNNVQDHLANINKPFVSFIFTGSTHSPFGTLPKQFLKYPHGTDTKQGFMNTLYYADWAIGQFMEHAKKQPWFDDTVFFFTADHTAGIYRTGSTLEQFHVPLVIYSPKHIKPAINNAISSHLDIMPTVLDILNLSDTYSALGESLLRKKDDDNAFAHLYAGNLSGIVKNDGFIMHTLQKVVEAKTLDNKKLDIEKQNALERQLLTIDQSAYHAITSNTWQP